MFSGRSSNPHDQAVENATAETLTSEPWDQMLAISDKVTAEGATGAQQVVQSIQKRFVHRNANVQLYALTLADVLVSNCGEPLHREVASNAFTESMKRLALDRTSHDSVKKRAASLIKKWSGEFAQDTRLGLMNDAYETLRSRNVVFPDEDASAPPEASRNDENELARREEEDMQRAIRESELEAERQQARYGGGYVPAASYNAPPPPQPAQQEYQAPPPQASPYQPQPAVSTPGLPGGFPPTDTSKPLPAPSPTPPLAEQPQQAYQTASSSAAPVPQDQPHISRAQALYDFEPDPTQPGELPLRKGDIVRVLERAYQEWWRGECRGRIGIFPVNWVQELPEPTPQQLADEAQYEVGVFAQISQVDQLLDMLRAAEERQDVGSVGDDEQVTQLYQQCLVLRPKILKLIERHTQKKIELLDINAKFVQAKRGYENMLEESWAKHSSAAQPAYGNDPYYYAPQQQQQQQQQAAPQPQQEAYNPPQSIPYAQPQQQPEGYPLQNPYSEAPPSQQQPIVYQPSPQHEPQSAFGPVPGPGMPSPGAQAGPPAPGAALSPSLPVPEYYYGQQQSDVQQQPQQPSSPHQLAEQPPPHQYQYQPPTGLPSSLYPGGGGTSAGQQHAQPPPTFA